MFPLIADQVQQRWPLPEGVQAHAALCGDWINRSWNGDSASNALGFQGLLAKSFEWDDEVEEEVEYVDLPQWHVCYVNLAAHHRENLGDDLDTASIIASLATLAHEMAHVALFARHTNGETPLEIFDREGHEGALAQINQQIEDDLAEEASGLGLRGATEDVVEDFARDAAWDWYNANGERARELVGKLIKSLETPQGKTSRAKPRR